jgi:hypothetical protein
MAAATHMESLKSNMKEVERLLDIHKTIAGAGVGRKRNVEVLNKSAMVLLLACWEAFVEDLATDAFDKMLQHAHEPTIFPEFVLAIAAKELKKADTLTYWSIAKAGWKPELTKHRNRILAKYVERGSFNTPSSDNIDKLFAEMVGLTSLSKQWHWPGMGCQQASDKLGRLIETRGNIAHRVSTAKSVKKSHVVSYRKFLYRLAVITHNRTLAFIYARTKRRPWARYHYGNTK